MKMSVKFHQKIDEILGFNRFGISKKETKK